MDFDLSSRDDATVYAGAPLACDLCRQPISDTFIDGRTAIGPWACMCPACFLTRGVGLGTGLGQLYRLQATGSRAGRFIKVAG